MQAIVTKFLGPTNYRGARVKAKCEAGSVVVSWDDALDANENHDKAAHSLADKLGWLDGYHGEMVGGGMPDTSGNCYVFVKKGEAMTPFTLDDGIAHACRRAARERSATFAVYQDAEAVYVRDAKASPPAKARLECMVQFWLEREARGQVPAQVQVQIRRSGARSEWREVSNEIAG